MMKTRHKLKSLARRSRGQSLVEVAMTFPLLLAVGFLITEFGRALWIQNVVTQACREGAREACVENEANAPSVAMQKANEFLTQMGMADPNNNPAIVSAQVVTSSTGARQIEVRASRIFSFIPGDVPSQVFAEETVSETKSTSLTAGQFMIRSSAVMMLEGG